MIRHLFYSCIFILLVGCSSIQVQNGYLVNVDKYRVPIISNESWLRVIPAADIDALYLRCPDEQMIAIFDTMLCNKFYYSEMSADDYVNRIYKNTYFSFWEKSICPDGPNIHDSPLTDKYFKKLDSPPVIDSGKKIFSIVYETDRKDLICSSNSDIVPLKVMDVFIEEQKFHFWGAIHTRFMVFRYASRLEQYENGIDDFKEMVSKFEWINQ